MANFDPSQFGEKVTETSSGGGFDPSQFGEKTQDANEPVTPPKNGVDAGFFGNIGKAFGDTGSAVGDVWNVGKDVVNGNPKILSDVGSGVKDTFNALSDIGNATGAAGKAVGNFVVDAGYDAFKTARFATVDTYKALTGTYNEKQYWEDLGGITGFVMDIGIAATALSGQEEFLPEEVAIKSALSRTIMGVAKGSLTTKGFGAGAATEEFAKSKAAGEDTGTASIKAGESGILAMAGVGLFNKISPYASNAFLKMIKGSVLEKNVIKKVPEIINGIKDTINDTRLGKTSAAIKAQVMHTSSNLANTVSGLYSHVAAGLQGSSQAEMTAVKESAFTYLGGTEGKAGVEGQRDIVKKEYDNISQEAHTLIDANGGYTEAELAKIKEQASVSNKEKVTASKRDSMIQDTYNNFLIEGQGKGVINQAKAEALMEQATRIVDEQVSIKGKEATAAEAITKLSSESGTYTSSEVHDAIASKIDQDTQNSIINSKYAELRKSKLRDIGTPEAQALLGRLDAAEIQATKNDTMSSLAYVVKDNIVGKEGGMSVVQPIMDWLNSNKGNSNLLEEVLGADGIKMFKKAFSKQVFSDVADAYKLVLKDAKGEITPKVLEDAQKAAEDALTKYTEFLNNSSSGASKLFSDGQVRLFHDLADIVPNIKNIGENIGIDMTALKEGGLVTDAEVSSLSAPSTIEKGVTTQESKALVEKYGKSNTVSTILNGSSDDIAKSFLTEKTEVLESIIKDFGENSPEVRRDRCPKR